MQTLLELAGILFAPFFNKPTSLSKMGSTERERNQNGNVFQVHYLPQHRRRCCHRTPSDPSRQCVAQSQTVKNLGRPVMSWAQCWSQESTHAVAVLHRLVLDLDRGVVLAQMVMLIDGYRFDAVHSWHACSCACRPQHLGPISHSLPYVNR